MAPLILKVGTAWKWLVQFIVRPLYTPFVPLHNALSDTQSSTNCSLNEVLCLVLSTVLHCWICHPAAQYVNQICERRDRLELAQETTGQSRSDTTRVTVHSEHSTLSFIHTHFIHLAVCLTTGPKPLPKQGLHIVRSRASIFRCEYPLLSLRSSSSFLRLLPRLPVTSIPPFISPSITFCTESYPGPPGWGLSVRLTLQPRENFLVTKTKGTETGLMERRLGRTQNRRHWNRNELKPRLRWEDAVMEHVAQLGCRNWTAVGINREGWGKSWRRPRSTVGCSADRGARGSGRGEREEWRGGRGEGRERAREIFYAQCDRSLWPSVCLFHVGYSSAPWLKVIFLHFIYTLFLTKVQKFIFVN
jgi:hypothetical protein